MSRKKRDYSREIQPDPIHGDLVVAKTVNCLMRDGKKSVAERALYKAFETVEKTAGAPAMEVFAKALSNIRPLVEVRSRRVGGANYQVPTEIAPARGQGLAIRWLAIATGERTEKTLHERLSAEILDAASNRGFSVKKREDTHKMAEANRAFSHFKW